MLLSRIEVLHYRICERLSGKNLRSPSPGTATVTDTRFLAEIYVDLLLIIMSKDLSLF
jgi:hypothetical protein